MGGRLVMGLGNGLKRVSAMSIMFLSLKKLVVNMTDINGKHDKILIFEKAEKLVLG